MGSLFRQASFPIYLLQILRRPTWLAGLIFSEKSQASWRQKVLLEKRKFSGEENSIFPLHPNNHPFPSHSDAFPRIHSTFCHIFLNLTNNDFRQHEAFIFSITPNQHESTLLLFYLSFQHSKSISFARRSNRIQK
jgi:hypothetical protein